MKPLFLFLLLIPVASAFDCTTLPNASLCEELRATDEELITGLLYTSHNAPDHDAIARRNENVSVTGPPEPYEARSSGVIRDAWLALLTIQPSIDYQGSVLVPPGIEVRSEYNYSIVLPPDVHNDEQANGAICKILHTTTHEEAILKTYADERLLGDERTVHATLAESATLSCSLDITTTTRKETYLWERYCCKSGKWGCTKYCYRCTLDTTEHTTDTLTLADSKATSLYEHAPNATFTLQSEYRGTTKGELQRDNQTGVWLSFNQSHYTNTQHRYEARFIHKPFYLLQLAAIKQENEQLRNLIKHQDAFYVRDATNCTLSAIDHFGASTHPCRENYTEADPRAFTISEFSTSYNLLLRLGIFAFILYLLYKGIKKTWGKTLIPVGALLLAATPVSAEECGLTNLASCIPEKIYDFILALLNAPLQPLLDFIRTLMETPPSIDLFLSIWAIIVYCLSLFYGLLFLYAGFQFLFSGHNVLKREMAKEWLKNTVIMIVLIQASFYLYKLIIELGAVMTSTILTLVDPHFFLLTADNITNIGLEFLFVFTYVLILLVTTIFLTIRYVTVALGVLLAPIGIFCYFIPPLKSYGRLIIHTLLLNTFITFLAAIIILACSQLITIPLFEHIKILVMITCFSIIDLTFLILAKHVISKTSFTDGTEQLAQAAKYIAMVV